MMKCQNSNSNFQSGQDSTVSTQDESRLNSSQVKTENVRSRLFLQLTVNMVVCCCCHKTSECSTDIHDLDINDNKHFVNLCTASDKMLELSPILAPRHM